MATTQVVFFANNSQLSFRPKVWLERQITMFATRNRSLWLNQTQVNVSTGAVCPLGDAFPRVFFIELGCRFI